MNSTLKLPKDQIAALRPRDVQHYLTSRGWVVDERESSAKVLIFRHPSMDGAEIAIPLHRTLGDYLLRMADVARDIAVVEQRSVWEVLHDLSVPPSDILRLRVDARETTLGSLPLDEGIELFRGGRDALLASACSVRRPQPFHPQKTLKDASDFIGKCRLGQTERGSFVATILTPVPPEVLSSELSDQKGSHWATEPFARRVTARLMASLSIVGEAAQSERLDPILAGIVDGVSANLCDALVNMKPTGEQSRLDIKMSWSRSRPTLPEGIPQSVTFTQPDFEFIEEAGRQLRARALPKRERFVGKVFSLQSEIATLFDDVGGKIIIRTEVGGNPARIKVVLNREDYRRACDAHRDEQRVAVTGIVYPDARIRVYELSEPDGFQVLADQ